MTERWSHDSTILLLAYISLRADLLEDDVSKVPAIAAEYLSNKLSQRFTPRHIKDKFLCMGHSSPNEIFQYGVQRRTFPKLEELLGADAYVKVKEKMDSLKRYIALLPHNE